MIYEIWDQATRNRLGAFSTKRDALALVQDVLREHGEAAAEALVLGREDDKGVSRKLAAGSSLVDLARRTGPAERLAGNRARLART